MFSHRHGPRHRRSLSPSCPKQKQTRSRSPQPCRAGGGHRRRSRYMSDESKQAIPVSSSPILLSLLQETRKFQLSSLQALKLYTMLRRHNNPGTQIFFKKDLCMEIGVVCQHLAQDWIDGYSLALHLARHYNLVPPGSTRGTWGADAVSSTLRIMDVTTSHLVQVYNRKPPVLVVAVEHPMIN